MDANKSYWGGVPANEKLTIRILPEGATRVAALEAGEVGMINNLPPDQAERIKSNPRLDTIEVMSTRIAMWPMTANRPPFNDVRVRRAVNYGLDKEGIVKAMLGWTWDGSQVGLRTLTIVLQEQPAYEFDLGQAKKLLAEAGAVGAKINYGYPSGRYLNDKQIGQVVAQQLENLGFVVNAETGEWGGLFQKMLNSHFDIWLAAYGTLTLDPDWALGWLYLSKDSWSKYNNPRVDELIQNGDRAFDPKIAEGTYQELQSIIWQDAANAWGYLSTRVARSKQEAAQPQATARRVLAVQGRLFGAVDADSKWGPGAGLARPAPGLPLKRSTVGAYLVRRVLLALVVLFGVSIVVFVIIRVIPGDPVQLTHPEAMPPELLRQVRAQMGLDDPVYVQYLVFLRQTLHGNLGESYRYHRPVTELVLERLPATAELTLAALAISLIFGIPMGIVAALKRNSLLDNMVMLVVMFGQSMPTFWLGIMLIIAFAVSLNWFPTSGREGAHMWSYRL